MISTRLLRIKALAPFAHSIGREDHADIELGRRRGTAGRMVMSLSTPDITTCTDLAFEGDALGGMSLTDLDQ